MFFHSSSLRVFQLEPLRCGGDRFSATGTLVILEPRVLNSNHCVLLFGMSYWLSPGFHWRERNIVASTVLHTKNWIHLKTNNLCKAIQHRFNPFLLFLHGVKSGKHNSKKTKQSLIAGWKEKQVRTALNGNTVIPGVAALRLACGQIHSRRNKLTAASLQHVNTAAVCSADLDSIKARKSWKYRSAWLKSLIISQHLLKGRVCTALPSQRKDVWRTGTAARPRSDKMNILIHESFLLLRLLN